MSAQPQRQRGQGMVEFLVAMLVMGPLLLGILQAILFYRAKSLVDYAALQAARSGAVHGASMASMRTGLARGLTPLYAHGSPGIAETANAFKDALVAARAYSTIEVISPTRAAFDDFKERQYDNAYALPNDSLAFRGTRVGSRSGLTVQDANILKLKVTYKYPLIVPLIDRLIGRRDLVRSGLEGHDVYVLPIVAQATVRMQSPIRDRNALPRGR